MDTSQTSPGAGAQLGAAAQLTGRESHLGEARAFIEQLGQRSVAVLPVFAGVGGSGKTTLLRHVAENGRLSGWFAGQVSLDAAAAHPRSEVALRYGLASGFGAACAQLHTLRPGSSTVSRVADAIATFCPDAADRLPVLARPSRSIVGSLRDDLLELCQTVGTAVADLTGSGFLITIDDLHCVDEEDAYAILSVGAAAAAWSLPVALIASGTPSIVPLLHRAHQDELALRALALDPLEIEAVYDILSRATVGQTIDHDAARQVQAFSGGNPLMCMMVASTVFAGGARAILAPEVPALLVAAEEAYHSTFLKPRFGRLDGPARRFVAAVAAAELPANLAGIAQVVGDATRFGGSGAAAEVGRRLLRNGFLFSVDRSNVQFSYPGAREHALGMLTH